MAPRSSSERSAGADLTADVDLTATGYLRCDLHDPRTRAEVEASLGAVPGILGARLVPGFERPVDELHVLTATDKQPKQAVRDVQTVLMARYGVTTDHRVVSVVQLDEPGQRALRLSRPAFERLTITRSGSRVTIEVALREAGDEFVGTATSSTSSAARLRGVADATLEAARSLLPEGMAVDLEGAEIAGVLGQRVALTLVQLQTSRHEQTVAGSAVVRDDDADAVARSVLDALNRAIGGPA